MTKIVYCGICGKMIHGIERNCAYCGIPMCNEHNINGLCPKHAHTMNHVQVNEINKHRNIQIWTLICLCPIATFSLLFGILGLIYSDDLIFGIVSLAICVISVIIIIIVNRKSQKVKNEVYTQVNTGLQNQMVQICKNCGGPIPMGDNMCTNCGLILSLSQQQPIQNLPPPPPPPPQNSNQQQKIPPPPPGYTPNQDLNKGLQAIMDQNPGAEIRITSFYDGKTQSGFHICKYCNKKFDVDGNTTHCPYCNNPIHGEPTTYR